MVIDGRNYTNFSNVNVKKGVFRFGEVLSAAMTETGTMAIYTRGTSLYFWNGSSETAIGAAGAGGFTTWDSLYESDKNLTINSTTLTLALTHATGDGVTITGAAGSAGACLQLTHSNASGKDIDGTSSLWYATPAGTVFATALQCANIDAASGGNVNLAIDAAGSGTITIGGTSTGTITVGGNLATAANKTVTLAGVAGSTILTLTAGDAELSDGSLAITDADNASVVVITNNTITDSSDPLVQIVSTSLTAATALQINLTEAAVSGGLYLDCYDATGTASVFKVGEDGVTTIAGAGGSTMLAITAGDMTMSDGSLAITDADDAATFTVTNNTATSASVIVVAGSGAFTGSTTTSFMTVTPSGLATGTGIYAPFAALTTGKGVHITSGATQTTGSLLYVQDTGANCAITSGTAATFDLTATAITGTVNKIGAGVAITSSRTTTTGTVSDNWDLLSLVRTDIINGGGAMTATGSVLYVENAVTNTSGTVTDTTKGIEVVMDSLGTGAGIDIVHAATGGVALNITGAATSVSDVLITGSGVKADNKAVLEVTGSGATAAGSSILRVTASGTPAAATSYLAEFDYSGATVATNDPITVQITSGDSVGAALNITSTATTITGGIVNVSGASATTGILLNCADANALTTGSIAVFKSNSADTTARSLVTIHNDHASSVGVVPLTITQDSPKTTHFYAAIKLNSNTIWIGDGTTANSALAATTGDILINGGSNKPEYCTNGAGSAWTALA